ncbi:hypothetical protein [Umezawaea beigongshangensis]|uniref:hypothetical protein n=1 Tax=Umezawaea beigongshangensis TaxID=2780383 RepID=UPI0018F115BA|nr:hypothetical protein [Umezawaea beigongshangensis]
MNAFLVLAVVVAGLVLGALLWKFLATAAVIAAVQWAVTTQAEHPAALALAYAVPALAVAYLITRRRAPRLPRSLRTAHAYRGGLR